MHSPSFSEVEEKLSALIAGRITREEADRWASRWVNAADPPPMAKGVWAALLHLAGCDLRHGAGAEYLHSARQLDEWLSERRASESESKS